MRQCSGLLARQEKHYPSSGAVKQKNRTECLKSRSNVGSGPYAGNGIHKKHRIIKRPSEKKIVLFRRPLNLRFHDRESFLQPQNKPFILETLRFFGFFAAFCQIPAAFGFSLDCFGGRIAFCRHAAVFTLTFRRFGTGLRCHFPIDFTGA